jgi:hypothetical protein
MSAARTKRNVPVDAASPYAIHRRPRLEEIGTHGVGGIIDHGLLLAKRHWRALLVFLLAFAGLGIAWAHVPGPNNLNAVAVSFTAAGVILVFLASTLFLIALTAVAGGRMTGEHLPWRAALLSALRRSWVWFPALLTVLLAPLLILILLDILLAEYDLENAPANIPLEFAYTLFVCVAGIEGGGFLRLVRRTFVVLWRAALPALAIALLFTPPYAFCKDMVCLFDGLGMAHHLHFVFEMALDCGLMPISIALYFSIRCKKEGLDVALWLKQARREAESRGDAGGKAAL